MKNANNSELSNLQVSIRSLSELTGLHRDVLRSSISRANLAPSGNRGGYASYGLKAALSVVLSRRGDADPEMLTPGDRRSVAQAKILEHQLLVKNGEYLPREAFRNAVAESYARCAATIKGMPDNFEHKLGLNPAQVEFAEEVVNLTLQTLFDDLRRTHEESTVTA